jgi:hypothetical protein
MHRIWGSAIDRDQPGVVLRSGADGPGFAASHARLHRRHRRGPETFFSVALLVFLALINATIRARLGAH